MAYYGGKFMAEYLSKRLGPRWGKGRLISEAIKIYRAGGWGNIELVKYSPEENEIVLRLYHSFECEAFKGSEKPMSSFVKGHINGLVSGILDRELSITETRCIAVGDLYCEFKIRPE
jgi:predicted hydrocarbon binding protein